MVIDASALLAILLDDPARARLQDALSVDSLRLVSAITKLEAGAQMTARYGPDGAVRLDRLLRELNVTMIAFDETQADIALDAFIRYGRGRHVAVLGFAACAAYALSMSEAEPLLSADAGFADTDVERVSVSGK